MTLLDTHVLLWLRVGDARLGHVARLAIDEAWRSGDVAVSAISFWEAAMLEARRRIELAIDVQSWRREQLGQGLTELAVDGEVGVRAAGLVDFHRDPADRLIVATALEGHRLMTADQRILAWSGELQRMDARR